MHDIGKHHIARSEEKYCKHKEKSFKCDSYRSGFWTDENEQYMAFKPQALYNALSQYVQEKYSDGQNDDAASHFLTGTHNKFIKELKSFGLLRVSTNKEKRLGNAYEL